MADDSCLMASSWPNTALGQVALELPEGLGVGLGDRLGRDAGDFGDHRLHFLEADHLLPPAFGQQHLRSAGFVDNVDSLVGQLAVGDVLRRQFHSGANGFRRIFQLVEFLVVGLQALEDLDCVFHRRLVDVDLLETAHQGAVLLEVLAELLVGGRAHAAQVARRQGRLEQVGGVHGAAARGARADHRVDLVDEEDRVLVVFQLLDDLFDALLEVAAVAGAGQQRAHVEAEDRRLGQDVGHLMADDLAGQPLRDGGLADPRIADQQRVVLVAPAQDLDAALDLVGAADQRIDLPLAGLLVEVDAIGFERLAAGLRRGAFPRPRRRPLAGRGSEAPAFLAIPWAMKFTAS